MSRGENTYAQSDPKKIIEDKVAPTKASILDKEICCGDKRIGSWDKNIIYISGGRMQRNPFRFLTGSAFVTVSKNKGQYMVRCRQQEIRCRGWRFGDVIIETFYQGNDIIEAAKIANRVWHELREAGVSHDIINTSRAPDAELLKIGEAKLAAEDTSGSLEKQPSS